MAIGRGAFGHRWRGGSNFQKFLADSRRRFIRLQPSRKFLNYVIHHPGWLEARQLPGGSSGDFFTKPRLGVIILILFGGDGSAQPGEGIPARILGGWGFDRGRTWDRFAASLQTSKSENPYVEHGRRKRGKNQKTTKLESHLSNERRVCFAFCA